MAERLRIEYKQILSGYSFLLGRIESQPNHGGKSTLLAQVVAERRCLNHLLLRYPAPVQPVTGLDRQLTDELALCSSVAIAEGMQAI
jgi:hypothetical protein